jgi:hypothetical protein
VPDTSRKLPTPATATDSAAAAAATAATAATLATPLSEADREAIRTQISRELTALADTLKLTPEQRAKARPILLDQANQLRQLRVKYAAQAKSAAVTEEMKKEVQLLRDATDARLAQVFTSEQMAVYKVKRDAGVTKLRSKQGGAATAATPPPAVPATPAAADTAKKK